MKTGPHPSLASLLAATAFVSELLTGEPPAAEHPADDAARTDPYLAGAGDVEFPPAPFTPDELERLERAIKLEATARCLRRQIRELSDELSEVETRIATNLEGLAARRRRP